MSERKAEMVGGMMQFIQPNDSNSTEGSDQFLEIAMEDAGGGKFFVIKTYRWSFDSAEELLALIEKARVAFDNDTE